MSEQEQPGSSPKGAGQKKGTAFGLLGVLGIVLLKAKGLGLIALQALGSFKFLYFFKSFFSMFLMIGIYTAMFGWLYAVIIVTLLLIHEMGHYIFMKAMNLDPKMPVFLPFLGAYVQMQKLPAEQITHAWVAIAGPLVGGVTSVGMFMLGISLDNKALVAAGNTGVMLNILQLIPCKPLDGGFIVNAISKWFFIPGTIMAFVLAMMFGSPLLFVIAIVSSFQTFKAFTRPVESGGTIMGQKPATLPEKIMVSIAYFGLLAGLGYVYYISHNELISFAPIRQRL